MDAATFTNCYAVILSGGSGTRFWPKSTRAVPKQLCQISHPELTMLEETLARLDGLIPPERRLIVTHKDQLARTQALVKDACGHYLAEPEAKNTAAALTLAALSVKKLSKSMQNSVIVSLHADHVIGNRDLFIANLASSVKLAEQGYLSLMGIKPTYPETGYGYIEKGSAIHPDGFVVASFREKPSLDLASQYVAAKTFSWNSGIFAWQTQTYLDQMNQYLPTVLAPLTDLFTKEQDTDTKALAQCYSSLPKIAIDQGLLEKSNRIAMIEATFEWRDMGHWAALAQHFGTDAQGNLALGKAFMQDSTGTTVYADKGFVATIGVKDLVVVSTANGVLVCHKDAVQEVKKVVDYLAAQGREDLY